MSGKKGRDKEGCFALESIDFKNALAQFQNLVEKMIIQKTKESSGLYTKDDDEIDYEKFYKTTRTLFGSAVKDQDIQAFFRKIMSNPDERPEWIEIFGCFSRESVGMSSASKETLVLLVSEKQQITHSVVKRKDVIKGIVKVPLLRLTVTASQKGMITVFSKKMKVLATINIEDTAWITGCDFLPNLKYVVAVTESTIILWDYKSKESESDGFVIKPMKNCLLCVCTVTMADNLAKDTILMGDDKGYVYLLTITSDDFIMKQSKAEKVLKFKVMDSESFDMPKRKLHDDWVGKIKYFPALKRFGSCSTDSINSFVLDDIKRLEDHLPVKEFSVPKGVNAFTYCGKAKVIVTGGNDRILRLWNPVVNFSPTGKLFGHKHGIVEIVTNEKDQHVISLSCAKVFRVWDIQTLSPLQVFYESHGTPEEMNAFPMIFDNDHGLLFTGSDVIDIYPLANVTKGSKEMPQTHKKSLNVLLYNRTFHQILSICTESILKVWDLETGSQIYQIEDAHGQNTEVTCAAIERNGVYLATGACDGTVKIWEFESGQEVKALPLTQNSDDEHRVLKILYLKADGGQHAVIVLEQRGKIKIIQGDSAQTHLYVTWVLPEIVPFPRRNPVVYLSLRPASLETQDFFPEIRLLCNTSSMRNDRETFLSSVDIRCFDILQVEGSRMMATGSANGEINLWDFETASVKCLRKTTEDSEVSGVNAILFLVRSVPSSRKRSSLSSAPSVRSNATAIAEHRGSSSDLHEKNAESDEINTEITDEINTEIKTAEETTSSEDTQNPEVNEQLLKARAGLAPLLVSAHESSCIRLWSIQGNLMKELLPFAGRPSGPLTTLCTDIFTKILLTGTKEGYVFRWNMASFLEDSRNIKNAIKEELCWRAHAAEVVDLFIEEEKNVVATASIDGSVRLWHARTGYYFGFFGQARKFDLTDTSRLILPSDVSDFSAIIKEEIKRMEKKKIIYPLMLDRDKLKSLTGSPSDLEKDGDEEPVHSFKFFRALAPEKIQPMETFEFASKEAGAVFGFLPIYEHSRTMSQHDTEHRTHFHPLAKHTNGTKCLTLVRKKGLLQFIKEAAEPSHVKKYKGMTVAVDTYCWLHKGAYACAEKLARGEPTDFYVAFCMKLVHMLLSFGIKPILVFDGCTLPSKKEVEKARRERRQASLLKGKQLLQEGRLSEARECFGRSVNITHAMAHEVIQAARAQGVDCIVAPYEADAQLAYLNKIGMVQAIITEDSDLLAFGCKKVFLKIDKFGNGLEIDQTRLGNCKQLGNVFTEEKFRYMCILSGCDYLPSIHGIGLAKACKLLKLANNPDIIKVIKKMGQYLKMNITVPEEYIQGFTRANNTFLYQLVFDPVNRKLVPLNAYEDDIDPETLTYAGRHVGDDTAFQIAIGNVDINTMEQIDSYNPDMAQPVQQRSCGWNDQRGNCVNSIWSREYKFGPTEDPAPPKIHFPEKPLTKGMEKIISVKGLKLAGKELLSKRPRSDSEEVSDGDLLKQYSFSKTKRVKKENDNDGQAQKSVSAIQAFDSPGISITQESTNSLPRVRNKFASFLQRKNKEKDAVIVPGTRSRFFCNDAVMLDSRTKKEGGDLTEDAEQDCQKQEGKHVAEDVSSFSETEKSSWTVFTSLGEMQKSCSQWYSNLKSNSGNLGLPHTVLSQQFHQQRNCIVSQEDQINAAVCNESEEESSPLIELEQSSQSHGSCEPSECSLESSEILQVSNNSLGAKESDSSSKLNDDQCSLSELFSAVQTNKKNPIIKTKVPGLRKSSNIRSHMVTKLKPLIPAKVSGLSRKLSPVQKRKDCDTENKMGLQSTIGELWKSFQFKREYEKLPSCRKSDPLSPIKDNIQLTPETEEEIFNHLERSHVQRAIFQ